MKMNRVFLFSIFLIALSVESVKASNLLFPILDPLFALQTILIGDHPAQVSGGSISLCYRLAKDPAGMLWGDWIQIPNTLWSHDYTLTSDYFSSLNITGCPAVVYSDGALKYTIATSPQGLSWNFPVVIDLPSQSELIFSEISLIVADGHPAVVYTSISGDIKFARALNINGSS